MAERGVFSDRFYNAMSRLPNGQYNSTSQASGTLAASVMAGAAECYVASSGATALTTDTAANIVAQMSSLPNFDNVSYFLQITNTNAGTLTLTGGTGVTINGTATLATNTTRAFLVTVNSAAPVPTVTMQNVGSGTP